MKTFLTGLMLFVTAAFNFTQAQQYINKVQFFKDTSVLNATLTFNMKRMLANKSKQGYIFPATFSCKMGDSLDVNDHISIEVRGHFRRGYCFMPPIKMIYKNNASSAFYKLKKLKLVSACMISNDDDQNLLKEYIIYKLYNLITERSFRVRLLKLNYQDSSGRMKTISQHAFLLEDIGELAKRNDCEDWTDRKFNTERTNRRALTITNIFEYMIGNADWSVPGAHNIKLIHSKSDSISRPYVVPYDFDYSGFVNASYAIPDERFEIETVRQRVYRGFPRTIDELNETLDIFKKQKANIYATISHFNLFAPRSKKEMLSYLDEFYSMINDPALVQKTFITHARTQ